MDEKLQKLSNAFQTLRPLYYFVTQYIPSDYVEYLY